MLKKEYDFLKKTDLPIYIWGGGEVGLLVKKKLNTNKIFEAAIVVDNGQKKSNTQMEIKTLLESQKNFIIVRGFLGSFFMTDQKIMEKFPGCKKIITICDIYEPDFVEPLTSAFYEINRENFISVRNNLSDELSKVSFDNFIKAKITNNNEELLHVVEKRQYFFDSAPWKYSDEDILIDGGAFVGDSIIDFVHLRGNKYKKIIAVEPDRKNYEILIDNIKQKNISNIEAIQCGLYSKDDYLCFDDSGTMMSNISEKGIELLKVDAIDNIASNEKVSIIKMDVEGSEMDALKGARNTIINCRPILMISAYHKKDDLFNIYKYIVSIVDKYHFFFRCHKPMPIDAVLYAVPIERVI